MIFSLRKGSVNIFPQQGNLAKYLTNINKNKHKFAQNTLQNTPLLLFFSQKTFFSINKSKKNIFSFVYLLTFHIFAPRMNGLQKLKTKE